jgi:RNA-binding protein PNO1
MDDELLLDAPTSETNAIQPIAGDADTEMHIDEEGRPRFAPAKASVRNLQIGLNFDINSSRMDL